MKKSLYFLGLGMPLTSYAANTATQVTPLSTGSVLSVIFGLLVVLALLLGTAWLVRRLQCFQGITPGILQPIAQQQLGIKERVMLLRIDQENILIACSHNGIRTLHTWQGPMPAGINASTTVADAAPFVDYLKRLMAERRS